MRTRPVRDETAERFAVAGHEPVESIGQSAADDPVAHQRPVSPHEAPAGEPLGLRKRLEESGGRRVGQREEREPLANVQARDATRREAAESSARVVQQDGPAELH